jgi:hypothetical protein
MIRNILSVIAAYIAMAITIFLTFTLLYSVLGADGSFKPGSYDVTNTWAIASVILGFIAVLIGGYIAVLISKNQSSALWFGIVVLILSLLLAIFKFQQGNPHLVRSGDVSNMLAMGNAQNPTWLNFLVPFTGFFAALVGGKLRKVR